MRGILIDSERKTVEEVTFDFDLTSDRPYRKINEMIGCDIFTVITLMNYPSGSDETLYTDDESLLNDPKHFFQWKDYHQPLAGRGLILGTDCEGETIGTALDLAYVKSMVSFPAIELVGIEPLADSTTTIGGKEFFVVGSRAVFRPKTTE